jgi:lysophospholipase L1-like esterase
MVNEILLIGDSLTEWYQSNNGWGEQMKKWYDNKATIINKGFGGYTSEMIKNMITDIIGNKKNNNLILCTILLGTNDCYFVGRQTSSENYKKNILFIIDYIHNINPHTIILLATPPTASGDTNKIIDYVNKVHQIKKERPYIYLIDLHKDPFKIIIRDLYDGIHFNQSGSNKLFQNIQYTIIHSCNKIRPAEIS